MQYRAALSSAFLAGLALIAPAFARADHFMARRVTTDGQERGLVVSHGMTLFEIRGSAGGHTAPERARIVAQRLEQIADAPNADLSTLSVAYRSGDMILQQDASDGTPRVVATLDRTAPNRGAMERQAQWWLALLHDQLALASGQRPTATVGTPVGATFRKLYRELGQPTAPVASDDIDRAIESLTDDERQTFQTAARTVPAEFTPDAKIRNGDTQTTPRRKHPVEDNGGDASGGVAAVPGGNGADTPDAAGSDNPPADNGATRKRRDPQDNADATDATDTAPPVRRPAPNRNAKSRRVVVSGAYQVELVTDPAILHPGETAPFRVRLSRTDSGGNDTNDAAPAATVRAWITKSGAKLAAPTTLDFDDKAGVYTFDATAADAGGYTLTIGALTDDGEAIRAKFPFAVAPEPKPEPAPDTPDRSNRDGDNGGSDAARPIRRGAPLTRSSGDYDVTLTLRPSRLTAGVRVSATFDLYDTAADKPLTDATLDAYLLARSQNIADADPIAAGYSEESGAYLARLRPTRPGAYRLVVRGRTATGKRFEVTFPLTVSAASADDNTAPE